MSLREIYIYFCLQINHNYCIIYYHINTLIVGRINIFLTKYFLYTVIFYTYLQYFVQHTRIHKWIATIYILGRESPTKGSIIYLGP